MIKEFITLLTTASPDTYVIALILVFITFVCYVIALILVFAPVKVVELRLDPPENAHYMLFTAPEDGELDEKTKEAINKQKEQEVFYHAFFYLGGVADGPSLYACINENWNKQYEKYPEYKHWKIGKNFVESTLKEWDFTATGRVIILAEDNSATAPAGAYVLMRLNGREGRRLVALADLVTAYLAPPPEPKRIILKELPRDVYVNFLKAIYSPPAKVTELPLAAD